MSLLSVNLLSLRQMMWRQGEFKIKLNQTSERKAKGHRRKLGRSITGETRWRGREIFESSGLYEDDELPARLVGLSRSFSFDRFDAENFFLKSHFNVKSSQQFKKRNKGQSEINFPFSSTPQLKVS